MRVSSFLLSVVLFSHGASGSFAPAGPTAGTKAALTPGALAAARVNPPDNVYPASVSTLRPADLSDKLDALKEDGGGGVAVATRGGGPFGRAADPPSPQANKANKALVGVYFVLWYAFNIAYNITNKCALNSIRLPWTISVTQLLVGSTLVLPMWMLKLRETPRLSADNINALIPIAFCHMMSHVCAVIGLGAGAVSFVHIVKAAEPLFTALFSAVFLGQIFSPVVYATLIPVVGGVALASLKELDFKWVALAGAMGSNLAASSRAILSKRRMGMDMGENMNPANLYGVLTILASVILIPLSAMIEGPHVKEMWKSAVTYGDPEIGKQIILNTMSSGLFFYLYNEVAFRCLHVVHPVTHAVGNTFKRVFLIATSVLVFKNKLTPLAAVGSALAIGGVLLYSLATGWAAEHGPVKAQASR